MVLWLTVFPYFSTSPVALGALEVNIQKKKKLFKRRITHDYKGKETGIPVVAQKVKNLTSINEDEGSIPGLTQ